jgi:hypothetical protein
VMLRALLLPAARVLVRREAAADDGARVEPRSRSRS